MKITFYSNFLTHHQLPFCMEMIEKYGEDFKFVSTIKIPEERLKLGYKDMDRDYPFVIRAYENEEQYKEALKLAVESDIVMMGSTSDIYIEERLKQDKLTFRYRERIFFKGIKTIFDFEKMKTIYEKHIKYKKNKNLYMLCASAYGPNDFSKLGAYKGKMYKWGYFPKTYEYDINKLMQKKETTEKIDILWTGRFIKWKHPEYMIKLAEKLQKDNYKFKIQMLGTGELWEEINKQIQQKKLEDYIELVGPVESSKVREYMEQANIFIATSGKEEGWGTVLNEAMNSACAVIANKNMGAAPYLIQNRESGMLYSTFNELYSDTKELIENEKLRNKISRNAYDTIIKVWNSKTATNNLIRLFESIIKNEEITIEEGPASRAYPTKL